MERVLGLGGVFFRSADPEGRARWYRDRLGIDLVPGPPPNGRFARLHDPEGTEIELWETAGG